MSLQTDNEDAFLVEFEINEGLITWSDRLIGFCLNRRLLWIFRWHKDIAAYGRYLLEIKYYRVYILMLDWRSE